MKPFGTLQELRHGLKNRDFSAVELREFYLNRINQFNLSLNAYLHVDEEGSSKAAQRADKQLADGDAPTLCGIPIAHKDLFCTKGLPTTCASKMLASFVAPYDATVVEKVHHAGAVMLGKTNMDEFAMGSSNETSHFGPVRNPWDAERSPGGSSGGSAAAVAAGLTPLATGTDTGGSIRQPASLSGVTGLKPTYGRVSRFGMIAFASSLDQGGPIGHSVEDVATLLQVMEGHDVHDSTSADVAATQLPAEYRQHTIGYPESIFTDVDPRMVRLIEDARAELEGLGHQFVSVDLPYIDEAIAAYYVISGAEASTNLARFDGVRYGYRAPSPVDLADLYCRSRSEGFGLEVKRRILTGTYSLSIGYFDAYYLKAQKIRRLVRDSFTQTFEKVDAILMPVAPTTAFPIGSMMAEPVQMYQQDIYTIPVSLAGLPALSLPCGLLDSLPVGMQLIGDHFQEGTVLSLGRSFQEVTEWHQQHPILEAASA